MDIGVDEAGRGPLFGRVYAAAVCLPPYLYDCSLIKDSKKIKNSKTLSEVSQLIREESICWGLGYATEKEVDQMNILEATMVAMHRAIRVCLEKFPNWDGCLRIDGSFFKSFTIFKDEQIVPVPHECVVQGDSKVKCIAAASILAKQARDEYITELVSSNPKLDEYYDLGSNKGYGTKKHLEGLKNYGLSPWHRKTFGICKSLEPWVVSVVDSPAVAAIQSTNIERN